MLNITPNQNEEEFRLVFDTYKPLSLAGERLWSEHKTKSLLGWRQLPRSRNSNREVWESPYLQVGVDVNRGCLCRSLLTND